MAETYLIWSNEHRAWWMPNSWGYTTLTHKAGRYGEREARLICERANLTSVNEVLVSAPPVDWTREQFETEVRSENAFTDLFGAGRKRNPPYPPAGRFAPAGLKSKWMVMLGSGGWGAGFSKFGIAIKWARGMYFFRPDVYDNITIEGPGGTMDWETIKPLVEKRA